MTPAATVTVSPQVSGVILRRLFREGSVVRQGQTLYQIDPSQPAGAVTIEVEVTPAAVRVRKRILDHSKRKTAESA